MVVSQNEGAQYRPQNTIVLIIWTPKKVPLILGNPHIPSVLANPVEAWGLFSWVAV